MPRHLLVIVHSREPSLGRVGAHLLQAGDSIDLRAPVFGAALPEDLSIYDGCIVFGGPQSANDEHDPGIAAELRFIPRWLESDKPFVGICLGGQLLTRALGGTVDLHPDGQVEIGYYTVHGTDAGADLFDGATPVFHWHKEGMSLPDGAVQIATGPTYDNQGYRVGAHVWALQFHPEMTRAIFERWLAVAGEQTEQPGAQSPDEIRRSHDAVGEAAAAWADRFLDRVFGADP